MRIITRTKGDKVTARVSSGANKGKQKTEARNPALKVSQQAGSVAGDLAQRLIPAHKTVHARNNVTVEVKPTGFTFDFPEV